MHKSKVALVEKWLDEQQLSSTNITRSGGQMLLLTGPGGSGKTTTLTALLKDKFIDLSVLEWLCPINENWFSSPDQTSAFTPVMQQFEEFMHRAEALSSLAFESDFGDTGSSKKSLILIKDLPHLSNYATRMQFHSIMLKYMHSNSTRVSLVLIYSDVESSWMMDNSNSDSIPTLKDILPSEILESRQCCKIEFNSVAKTYIATALKRLYVQEGPVDSSLAVKRKSRKQNTIPHTECITKISEGCDGDLRYAINILQFVMPITSATAQHLSLFAKDDSIGILHLTGKILHVSTTSADKETVVYEEIIENISASPDSLMAFLFENYSDFGLTVQTCSNLLDHWSILSHDSQPSYANADSNQRKLCQEVTLYELIGGTVLKLQVDGARDLTAKRTGFRPIHKPRLFSVFRDQRNYQGKVRGSMRIDDPIDNYCARHSQSVAITDILPFKQRLSRRPSMASTTLGNINEIEDEPIIDDAGW